MKKICISFTLIVIIVLVVIFGGKNQQSNDNQEYLRIHIRANSNLDSDQSIKLEVRDLVVDFLTPIIANCNTKSELINALERKEGTINALIEQFLQSKGLFYGAKTQIKNEKFPTRIYEGLTLEAGFYDAVIIELGEGRGDNWWCVVYPPLCFTASSNVKYRSKIYEIIKSFLKDKEN